jgi:predicted ribosome quality control (RQC) complex YloA/Tae2 family protein
MATGQHSGGLPAHWKDLLWYNEAMPHQPAGKKRLQRNARKASDEALEAGKRARELRNKAGVLAAKAHSLDKSARRTRGKAREVAGKEFEGMWGDAVKKSFQKKQPGGRARPVK